MQRPNRDGSQIVQRITYELLFSFSIELSGKWLRADNKACSTGFSRQTIWNPLDFVMHFCPSSSSSGTLLVSWQHKPSVYVAIGLHSPHWHQSVFPILPCSSVSLSSSDSDEDIHGSHTGLRSYGSNFETSRIFYLFEELLLYFIFFDGTRKHSCVSSGASYDHSGVDISFCKFSISS